MRIQELERLTGLDRSTIRFYEREGLVTPRRRENGYRDYSQTDCDQLLKIKLLRQLGMELSTIRLLQTGEQDFAAAMDSQIQYLQTHLMSVQQSRSVCQAIRCEVASYQELDAQHYLQLLSQMKQEGRESVYPKKVPEFDLPVKVQPVRRYIARTMDLMIVGILLDMILYVILRIRPLADGFAGWMLTTGQYLLLVPIEAALLHFFGTTPGKWCMGIRLESCDGGRLSFSSMLSRSWHVAYAGTGLGFPILCPWLMFRHYLLYTGKRYSRFLGTSQESPEELEWDTREWEIIYDEREGKWMTSVAAAAAAVVLINSWIVLDCMKPTYRSDDLTVSQFAENYNDYMSMIDPDSEKMQPDGSWPDRPENSIVLYINGEPEEEDKPCTFKTESGYIREITYENSYSQIFSMHPLPYDAIRIACIALQSQKGVWLWNVSELKTMLQEQRASAEGSIRYQNIEIQWTSQAENCRLTSTGYFKDDQNAESRVTVSWRIIIHNEN